MQSPAKWIWLNAGRTLCNTFVLFRHELCCPETPVKTSGFIYADSRYRLTVNGHTVQKGPAPCDPRRQEADTLERIAPFLRSGLNVIGVEALFFGQGEGTWAFGAPGFIMELNLEYPGGSRSTLVTDGSWQAVPDHARPAGMFRREFSRALQEIFDARRHPYGWDAPGFDASSWPRAAERGSAEFPSICYGMDVQNRETTSFTLRYIPLVREEPHEARLVDVHGITWHRDPDDWFDLRMADCYTVTEALPLSSQVKADASVLLTYCFEEQMVGYPYIEVEAEDGTSIELLFQEGHDTGKPVLMDNHHNSWARLICRKGLNRVELFEYESLRWIQLCVRNGPAQILRVGINRRIFPWAADPDISLYDAEADRVMAACVNTLKNSAIETIVDGMGRERQQYSGDCGHQLNGIRLAFGEYGLGRRFLETFSMGQMPEGYFLDTWPGHDRLYKLYERPLGISHWAPILDHGIQFIIDAYDQAMQSGETDQLGPLFPRFERFIAYLFSLKGGKALLPVENLGVCMVWLDHVAYREQRDKQCAFNLYLAAVLTDIMPKICVLTGNENKAGLYKEMGTELKEAAVAAFWDAGLKTFVCNLPWRTTESRFCDRSLANALIFDQCPEGITGPSLEILASRPETLGVSYPANAFWRYRALIRFGRGDVFIQEVRKIWARMPSVRENNAVQEDWIAKPDSASQWSHCAVSPLFLMYTDVMGISPDVPGYRSFTLTPRLAGFSRFSLTARTPAGNVAFALEDGTITITCPPEMSGTLALGDKALAFTNMLTIKNPCPG
jgi:hypothetical protein